MTRTVGCRPLYLCPDKCIKIEKNLNVSEWLPCFEGFEDLAEPPSPLSRLSSPSDSRGSIEVPSNLPKNPFPGSTGFETKLSVSALMWSITGSSLIARG